MDSPISTDAPCGRHALIEGTSPAARAAVEQQREQDAGMGKIHNLITESQQLANKQRRLHEEILMLTEQRTR